MLSVEVRDRSLKRQGLVDVVEFTVTKVFNGVGKWRLKVAAEDALVGVLRSPGSGIVCRFGEQFISGRTVSGLVSESAADPFGTWVFEGFTDEEQLAAKGVLPDGGVEPDAQTLSHYVAVGVFETVCKEFVEAQVGFRALPRRRALSVADDLGRGNNVRFEELRAKNVLEVLQERAVTGRLGFHVVQAGDGLVFDVYEPRDLTRRVQLDVWNGGLSGTEWGFKAPTVTEVWALGQGQGADRTLSVVTTAEAEAESVLQGIRFDTAIDRRDTDDSDVMNQDALELLQSSGVVQHSVKVDPVRVPNMVFGVDWWLGDVVTVVADGLPVQSRVNQVTVSVGKDAPLSSPTVLVGLGELTGFKPERQLRADVKAQDRRISALERQGAAAGGVFAAGVLTLQARVPVTIALPAGRFSNPPIIFCNYAQGYGVISVSNRTVSGFQVEGFSNGLMQWFAVEGS